jgi:ApaG protein
MAASAETHEATTKGVTVRVRPTFMPEQSDAARGQFTWAYVVEIENGGIQTVQLVSRHWTITDGKGHAQQASGPGVVGQQPTLKPGAVFQYESACRLSTPAGSMAGSYQMVTQGGSAFDALIPSFDLPLAGAEPRSR